MIKGLIYEREQTQADAIEEVSSKWGEEQTITGPVVTIPYSRYVRQYAQNDTVGKLVQYKDHLHFLPSELKINGQIAPEPRYRGVYEIVVYNSKLNISGVFKNIIPVDMDIQLKDIQFDKAYISVGISDLPGIEK